MRGGLSPTGARVRLVLFVAVTAIPGVLTLACNAIVGVEDVRPRRDSGRVDEEDGGDGPVAEGGGDAGGIENVFEVALGDLHSCARKTDGTMRCWGDDTQGQTGGGGANDGGVVDAPRPITQVTDAIDIASGQNHSCATRKSGKVVCWGYNLDGQLGNGETASRRLTPVDVDDLTGVTYVAAGGNFSCAIRSGGAVSCWGGNGSGQLGTGISASSPVPVPVAELKNAVSIAAGLTHACVIKSDGSAACWGDGASGQLGNGATAPSTRPVAVTGLPPASKIAAGARSTCALARVGTVHCWGANDLGQLGNGTTNGGSSTPVAVKDLDDAIAIAAGKNHACAVRKGGSVVCWGAGDGGQLGDGQARDSSNAATPTPVPVSGVTTAIGIGAGGEHSCAPTRTNAIVCWGAGDRGQLGNRSTTERELSPVSVVGYP